MTYEEFTELTNLTKNEDNEAFYREIVEPVYMGLEIGKRAFCIVFMSALNDVKDASHVAQAIETFISMRHAGTDRFFDRKQGQKTIWTSFA